MSDPGASRRKERSKKKKKPRWKRMLKKIRDKSRERWRQISQYNKESMIGQMFQSWTSKHHLPSSAQADSALLLQQQLEQYQAELENRKNRAPGEELGQLREGDDTLPYEQQPLSMNWVDKLQPAPEEPLSSDSESPSPVASVEPQDVSAMSSMSSVSTTDTSTSTSSTSEDSSEKTGHLTNILMAIIADAQKPESLRKEEEDNLQLPPVQLAVLSRNELEKFDKIVEENTKQGLFLSQPSGDEREYWNQRRARPHRMNMAAHQVEIVTDQIEKKIFCHSCIPRHPNYPHMRQVFRR